MKKCVLLLTLLALSGMAGANLLVNGDFESAGAGWSQWWGGNSNKDVTDPIEGDRCGGVWWSDDGIFQTISIGAEMYTVSGQMLHLSNDGPLGNNRLGLIKAEVKGADGGIWWVQEIVIDQTSPTDQWITGSTVIDNRTAGASLLTINLFMYDQNGPHTGSGVVRYDNISVVPEPATMGLLALGSLLLRRRHS